MAKVVEANPHIDTDEKLKKLVDDFVVESSFIEGIDVEPDQNEEPAPKKPA